MSPQARILFPDNIRIGPGSTIGECYIAATGRGVDIGADCEIHDGVVLDSHNGHVLLGEHVGLGPYVVIYGDGGVYIGSECAIAGHCAIIANSHGYRDVAIPIRRQPILRAPITIGANVWVGANSVILAGARLAEGVVVGACSLVRGEIAANTVVGGVPARMLKMRGFE